MTQNPPLATACRFEPGHRHQTNIIRTWFSLWEMGSDLFLGNSRRHIYGERNAAATSTPTGAKSGISAIKSASKSDVKFFQIIQTEQHGLAAQGSAGVNTNPGIGFHRSISVFLAVVFCGRMTEHYGGIGEVAVGQLRTLP